MIRANPRAVLDTHLLVSYLLVHRPPMATLIDEHLAAGRFTLLTAPALLQELDRVLHYPRLERTYDDTTRDRFVALVAALSELIELPDEIPTMTGSSPAPWSGAPMPSSAATRTCCT